LERNIKPIYKMILSVSSDSSPIIQIDSDETSISQLYDQLYTCEFNYQVETFRTLLARLESLGYVEYTNPDSKDFFRLTYKGLHRYAVQFQEFKSFILKSVIVPVVIAILASIITTKLIS